MSGARNTIPVLIVGGGPVGLTMACELARYGVDFRIVDKAAVRTDKSKALVLWSRTLELLERGIGAAPFVEAGLQTQRVSIMKGDDLIGSVDTSAVATPYPYALMIPQSETERLLEEQLERQGARVERSVEATTIDIASDGATVVLRDADGVEETVFADWLIGCDGAHSIVRHTLGVSFAGETFPSDWVLGDVHMNGYPHGTDVTVYWHREGVLVIFPIVSGRYRVLCDTESSGAAQPPAPTLDQLQTLLDRRGSSGMTITDPVWLAGFRINDRKVSDYRHGRVFLAGDAAHIHSPAGGQGMNTGMQDAFNLAWKLALVIQGKSGDGLLDSYSPERSYVGDQVLKAAGRLTKVATLKNPVAQHIRNFAMHCLLGFPPVQRMASDTVTEVAVHYPDSPLNGKTVRGVPRPGDRLEPRAGEIAIGSGATPRFALFAERTAAVEALVRELADLVDVELRPPLGEGAILLARPDGYVLCSADTPEAVSAHLRQVVA